MVTIEKEDARVHCTELRIEKLTVWTPEVKSWLRRRIVTPRNTILKDVTGCIKEGDFLAVLGPSGAGKTTLLSCLAGRCGLPRSGCARLDGAPVERLPRGRAELVPQREVFAGALSVAEHLRFMAGLKLGNRTRAEVEGLLATLKSEMMLEQHLNTPVKFLSGGERRLLALASALLSKPKIILCDEPTTGLDSCNALLVISALKKLSQAGVVVVCSIHQPSSVLFEQFNSLFLMSEGRLVFNGTPRECSDLFESINMKCPKNYNPAEFYIKAVSIDPKTAETHSDIIQEQFHKHRRKNQNQNGNRISINQKCPDRRASSQSCHVSKRTWLVQVYFLIWRSSLILKREIKQHIIQLFTGMVISSLIIGTCYAGVVSATQRGVQDTQGLLWLLTSEVAYGLAYSALFAFEADLVLYRREAGLYCSSAFFVAKFVSFIPKCVVWPSVYVCVATAAVSLPGAGAARAAVALVGTGLASAAYGLGMGAVFSSSKMLGDVMPCVDLPLFLAAGVFLRLTSLPSWMQAVRFCSQFYYGLDALNNIYWREVDYIECPSNSTQCIPDGRSVLLQSGYSDDYVLQDSLGLLLVTLGWSLIGYIGLKREESKGYAY